MNYTLLKRSLDLTTAIRWLPQDSSDDFYPDPIGWADIKQYPDEFLAKREHRIMQADTFAHLKEYVPKKSGMLREAVWLHPVHRTLYLAILQRFLNRLDPHLCAEVYSYRSDSSDDAKAYPFQRKMNRWKNFHNDFRRAALDDTTGAVLVTDIASYFDHIQIEQLGYRIKSILAGTFDESDDEVVQYLLKLLRMWGCEGFGLPHNLDASSFFGSVYLHNVDSEMIGKRYRYFRWIDDIRIVAKSYAQALRALHDLQQALAQYRLFPATDKTDIYEKGSDEFNALMDVADDILISRAEEVIARGLKVELEEIIEELFERLEFHAKPKGDDRKFRAFANRLMDISDYEEIETEITQRIQDFVIPRLKSHPERSDYWVKMLSARPTNNISPILNELLVKNPSIFDWQRFHLWRLATELPIKLIPKELFTKAIDVSNSTLTDNVTGQSIVFLGRHSDNTARENLFTRLFTAQRSYLVQRSILIAIQELPSKEYYFKRALEINSDHKELIDYLLNRDTPDYGIKKRPIRHCRAKPIVIGHVIRRGIGIAQGGVRTFRLSHDDFEY
jgi:hypothetical protein